MRRKATATAYVQTDVDVDVDLDDFAIEDLIEFIESEGYTVLVGKTSTHTKMKTEKLDAAIFDLYHTFLTDKGDNNDMDRALRRFFAEYYNKVSV
jgi:hypothetical protein